MKINGAPAEPELPRSWPAEWSRLELQLRRGQIDINAGNPQSDLHYLHVWAGRLTAAIVTLLPLEEIVNDDAPEGGLPEGARVRIEVSRYERDRRNRAAAIAIHGHGCKVCGADFAKMYGETAAGFIEVHHLTPVSQMGAGYVINPSTDLMPLCPNCHRVAHMKNPPYTPSEIQQLLQRGAVPPTATASGGT
jgi:5-methylcytosine-specific restriction protein A